MCEEIAAGRPSGQPQAFSEIADLGQDLVGEHAQRAHDLGMRSEFHRALSNPASGRRIVVVACCQRYFLAASSKAS
jgi:hypothetical protein